MLVNSAGLAKHRYLKVYKHIQVVSSRALRVIHVCFQQLSALLICFVVVSGMV